MCGAASGPGRGGGWWSAAGQRLPQGRQELTRLWFPFSGAANSEPLPASPPSCTEREGKSLAPGFPGPPPPLALPEKQKEKNQNPRSEQGTRAQSPRAPTFSPQAADERCRSAPPCAPGTGCQARESAIYPGAGAHPAHTRSGRGHGGAKPPPLPSAARPRGHPAPPPGPESGSAPRGSPAGAGGRRGAGSAGRADGECSRPHASGVPAGSPPPPPPCLLPRPRASASSFNAAGRGLSAGGSCCGVCGGCGAAVRRWCCGSDRPAARP